MLRLISQAHVSLMRDEKGATAIEYGLIAGLVAVVIITALGLLGGGLTTTFTTIATKLGATT